MDSVNRVLYDQEFFDRHTDETVKAARVVVPHVLRKVKPRRVVDVGCALGAWLKVFREHGAECVHGLDGSYVDRAKLLIPRESFTSVNLEDAVRESIEPVLQRAEGRYDLAVCLEVAEHLPAASAADLVRTLTNLAPVVLFSAAVPGQGGIGHINEQWPSYWKSLFEKRGYARVDAVRRRIWSDRRVHWWYRQNIFLFIDRGELARDATLGVEEKLPARNTVYIHCANRLRGWRSGILEMPRAALQAVRGLAPRRAGDLPKRERLNPYAPENR